MLPTPRSNTWVKKNDDHAKAVADKLECGANYVLIGSSHIARFINTRFNRCTWEEYFGPEYVTFANGGDRIEHTLWMIDRYNLPGGCDVAVVCIGGNNVSSKDCPKDPREIAKGIKKVAVQLHKNNKETLVLLCGIFPGDRKPIKFITKVNNILMDITRNCKNIFYLRPAFRDWADEGSLKEKLDFGDQLHLSGSGYKLFARYIADISQLSEKFKANCTVPYVRPVADTTLRYGITEPYIFYSTDSDPGIARGPWYKAPLPPHFNQVPFATPSSKSAVSRSIGLPGTHVVNHLGASVVYGGVS